MPRSKTAAALTPPPVEEATPSALGENLRRTRLRLGLSLAEVSARSGLAHSSLWKVENHQMSLTYDKLVDLAAGLEVDVAELFAKEPTRMAAGRRALTRAHESTEQRTSHGVYRYPCTELSDRRMTPMLADLTCATLEEFGPWSRHQGEEYVYVVQGPVVFASEFYAPIELQTGDSLYYDSGMGHAFLRCGDAPGRILSVVAGAPPAETTEAVSVQAAGSASKASRGQKGAVRRT